MYDRNLKAQWDRAAVMEYAVKEAAKEAAKEAEIRKNKEFALLMREKGEPMEKIMEYSGLTKGEIEKL